MPRSSIHEHISGKQQQQRQQPWNVQKGFFQCLPARIKSEDDSSRGGLTSAGGKALALKERKVSSEEHHLSLEEKRMNIQEKSMS